MASAPGGLSVDAWTSPRNPARRSSKQAPARRFQGAILGAGQPTLAMNSGLPPDWPGMEQAGEASFSGWLGVHFGVHFRVETGRLDGQQRLDRRRSNRIR